MAARPQCLKCKHRARKHGVEALEALGTQCNAQHAPWACTAVSMQASTGLRACLHERVQEGGGLVHSGVRVGHEAEQRIERRREVRLQEVLARHLVAPGP